MPSVMFEVIEVKVMATQVSEDVVKRRDALIAANKCIRCEEDLTGRQVRKFCCPACYQMAIRDLEARKTTKRELVTRGQWHDAAKGRPLKNKLRRA